MKRNASYTLLALGLTALLLYGCGGGNTGAPAGVNAGDARTAGAVIIIHWPTANSRFLHQRSDSVRVKVYADVAPGEAALPEGDEPVASKSATRSGGEATSEIQFERLPLYDLRFVVQAFASEKPGTILSRAETRTRLQPGASEPLEFTLESETAQIKIEPSPVALNTGQSVTLTVQALNADGQVILSSPDDFTFVSGNTAIATVDQSGAVTGVSQGSATVTVAERGTGSGRTVALGVAVAEARTYQARFRFGNWPILQIVRLTVGDQSYVLDSTDGHVQPDIVFTVGDIKEGQTIPLTVTTVQTVAGPSVFSGWELEIETRLPLHLDAVDDRWAPALRAGSTLNNSDHGGLGYLSGARGGGRMGTSEYLQLHCAPPHYGNQRPRHQ